MSLHVILGFLGALGLVIMAIVMGTPLITFIDTTSVLIVLGGTCLLLVASHGLDDSMSCIFEGLKRILAPGSAPAWSAKECRRAARVATSGGIISLVMGAMGSLIGLVQMLNQMEDPSKIGPAMAVALLTVFYALCLNLFLFVPLSRHYIQAAIQAESSTSHAS